MVRVTRGLEQERGCTPRCGRSRRAKTCIVLWPCLWSATIRAYACLPHRVPRRRHQRELPEHIVLLAHSPDADHPSVGG